jgi:hypothetical protein
MATAMTAKFNENAAGAVYYKAGTLDLKGMDWTYAFSTPTAKDVDVDATIKGSSIETNLAALEAGFKGTSAEASATSFKNAILSHPDLKKSAEAMLKDEGGNALTGMQKLLTDNGVAGMGDFKTMMDDPAKRKVVVGMFDAVATSKYGMDNAVEFTRLAVDASNNPLNMAKGEKFLKYAESMHIDTKEVKESGMKAGMMDMLPKLREALMSPDGFRNLLAQLPAMMGLSGEQGAAMQQLCNGLGGFIDLCLGTRHEGIRGIANKYGDSMYTGGKDFVERISGQRDEEIAKQRHAAGTGETVDPKSKAAMNSSKSDFNKVADDFKVSPEIAAKIDDFDTKQVATRTQPHASPGLALP